MEKNITNRTEVEKVNKVIIDRKVLLKNFVEIVMKIE